VPGTLIVGGVTVLAVALWRWRPFRLVAGMAALVGVAWALSGLG
jgi:competence protein ComEC